MLESLFHEPTKTPQEKHKIKTFILKALIILKIVQKLFYWFSATDVRSNSNLETSWVIENISLMLAYLSKNTDQSPLKNTESTDQSPLSSLYEVAKFFN